MSRSVNESHELLKGFAASAVLSVTELVLQAAPVFRHRRETFVFFENLTKLHQCVRQLIAGTGVGDERVRESTAKSQSLGGRDDAFQL